LAKFYWGEIESLGEGNKKMWQKIVDLGKKHKNLMLLNSAMHNSQL
jgi:hypothetical protein